MTTAAAAAAANVRQPEQNEASAAAPESTPRRNMTAPANENTKMKLDIESRQLQRSWREFHESLRYQDQQQRLQQPDDLAREIADDIQYWSTHRQQALFRKSIKWAQKCLDSMEAHAVLMQALPDSKYCDLFFGVVYSVVKAAREQYRVAQAFLKFLARINLAVASAVRIDCSTELAAALYGQIFLFLGEFLRDYVSKARCRLLYSHNEDFKTNFKNLVTSVENLAEMRLGPTHADASCVNHNCIDSARLERVGLEGAARKHASQTTTLLRLIWNTRHQKMLNGRLVTEQAKILEDFLASLKAKVHQVDVNVEQCRFLGSSTVHKQTHQPGSSESTLKRRLLKVILQHESSPLQDFFDNNEQIYPFGPDQQLEISAPIATTLFNWTQTNPSLPLAIEGPSHLTEPPNQLTLLSACYIFVARQNNIPVISHFCASSSSSPPRPSKKAGLIALVYSLIRQLIEIAPPMLNCNSNCDLSGERFRRLNGKIASWTDALSILDTLLHYRPPVLFCVIDSLDILGDDDNTTNNNGNNDKDDQTEQCIKSLVSMLASHTHITDEPVSTSSTSTTTTATEPSSSLSSSAHSPGLFKVLFTTTGQCHAINSTLVDQGLGQVITTDTSNETIDYNDDDDTTMTEG